MKAEMTGLRLCAPNGLSQPFYSLELHYCEVIMILDYNNIQPSVNREQRERERPTDMKALYYNSGAEPITTSSNSSTLTTTPTTFSPVLPYVT